MHHNVTRQCTPFTAEPGEVVQVNTDATRILHMQLHMIYFDAASRGITHPLSEVAGPPF